MCVCTPVDRIPHKKVGKDMFYLMSRNVISFICQCNVLVTRHTLFMHSWAGQACGLRLPRERALGQEIPCAVWFVWATAIEAAPLWLRPSQHIVCSSHCWSIKTCQSWQVSQMHIEWRARKIAEGYDAFRNKWSYYWFCWGCSASDKIRNANVLSDAAGANHSLWCAPYETWTCLNSLLRMFLSLSVW